MSNPSTWTYICYILSSRLLESGSQQIVQCYSNKNDPVRFRHAQHLDPVMFRHAQHLYHDLVAHFQVGVAASTSLDTLEQEIAVL